MAIILSLPPEEALGYLARIHSILLISRPQHFQLPQQVYIHTLGLPDHPMLRRGALEILSEFGFNPETFPAFAIQGYATIAELITYHQDLQFRQDRDAHGYTDSLQEYKLRSQVSQVWGVRFTDTYILTEPIVDVLPPSTGEMFWQMPQRNFLLP